MPSQPTPAVNGDELELNPLVICRQLGFTGGSTLYFPKDAPLPAGNDTVLTGALVCNGSEATLAGVGSALRGHSQSRRWCFDPVCL